MKEIRCLNVAEEEDVQVCVLHSLFVCLTEHLHEPEQEFLAMQRLLIWGGKYAPLQLINLQLLCPRSDWELWLLVGPLRCKTST